MPPSDGWPETPKIGGRKRQSSFSTVAVESGHGSIAVLILAMFVSVGLGYTLTGRLQEPEMLSE
jgi:hypothetical protein